MSGSENVYCYICYRPLNISYQALNVGLWSKIEGFCHLLAKLMVIFLIFTVSCHTTVFCESYLYGAMFFQVLMYEQFTVFFYSLYTSFACDVPNKYLIMHTSIKK